MGSHTNQVGTKKKLAIKRKSSPVRDSIKMLGGAISADEFKNKSNQEQTGIIRQFLKTKGYPESVINNVSVSTKIKNRRCGKYTNDDYIKCILEAIAAQIIHKECNNKDDTTRGLARKLQGELIDSLSGRTTTPMRPSTTNSNMTTSTTHVLRTQPQVQVQGQGQGQGQGLEQGQGQGLKQGQGQGFARPSNASQGHGIRFSRNTSTNFTLTKKNRASNNKQINEVLTLELDSLKKASNERMELVEKISELKQQPTSAQNTDRIAELQNALANKNKEIAEAKQAAEGIKEHQETAKRLEQELEKAQTELQEAKQIRNTLEQKETQSKINKLQAQFDEENKQFAAQLQKIQNQKEAEIQNLKSQAQQAEQEKQQAAAEMAQLRAQLAEAQKKANNQTAIEAIRKELEEAKATREAAIKEKEDALEKLNRKQNTTKMLKEALPGKQDIEGTQNEQQITDMNAFVKDKISNEQILQDEFIENIRKFAIEFPGETTEKQIQEILLAILDNIAELNNIEIQYGGINTNAEQNILDEDIEEFDKDINQQLLKELVDIYNTIVDKANEKFGMSISEMEMGGGNESILEINSEKLGKFIDEINSLNVSADNKTVELPLDLFDDSGKDTRSKLFSKATRILNYLALFYKKLNMYYGKFEINKPESLAANTDTYDISEENKENADKLIAKLNEIIAKLNEGKGDSDAEIPTLKTEKLDEKSFKDVMEAIRDGIKTKKKKETAEQAKQEAAEKTEAQQKAAEAERKAAEKAEAERQAAEKPVEERKPEPENEINKLFSSFRDKNDGNEGQTNNEQIKKIRDDFEKIPEPTDEEKANYKKFITTKLEELKTGKSDLQTKLIDELIAFYNAKFTEPTQNKSNSSNKSNSLNTIKEEENARSEVNKKLTEEMEKYNQKKKTTVANSRENTELKNKQQAVLSLTSTVIPTSANNAKANRQKKIDTINNFMANVAYKNILIAVLSQAQFPKMIVDENGVKKQAKEDIISNGQKKGEKLLYDDKLKKEIEDILKAKISDNIKDEPLNLIYNQVLSIIKANEIQKLSENRKIEIKRNINEYRFQTKRTGGKQITHNQMAKYKTHKKCNTHKRLQMVPQTLKITRRHK